MSEVKAFITDFDGTLTNGYVWVDEKGIESVRCSRRDSYGLVMLRKKGIKILVLTSEKSQVVNQRCAKMNVERVVSGTDPEDKFTDLCYWLTKNNLELGKDKIIYVGDDVNDKTCMKHDDIFSMAVNDAHPDIRYISNYILNNKGGEGAVREACDLVINGYEFLTWRNKLCKTL